MRRRLFYQRLIRSAVDSVVFGCESSTFGRHSLRAAAPVVIREADLNAYIPSPDDSLTNAGSGVERVASSCFLLEFHQEKSRLRELKVETETKLISESFQESLYCLIRHPFKPLDSRGHQGQPGPQSVSRHHPPCRGVSQFWWPNLPAAAATSRHSSGTSRMVGCSGKVTSPGRAASTQPCGSLRYKNQPDSGLKVWEMLHRCPLTCFCHFGISSQPKAGGEEGAHA